MCNCQNKWQQIYLDSISDLHLTRNRKDRILNVVDKAAKTIHLVLRKKDVNESGAANLISQNIVELHDIPLEQFIQLEGLSLASNFGENCGCCHGSNIRFGTIYHPRTRKVSLNA